MAIQVTGSFKNGYKYTNKPIDWWNNTFNLDNIYDKIKALGK